MLLIPTSARRQQFDHRYTSKLLTIARQRHIQARSALLNLHTQGVERRTLPAMMHFPLPRFSYRD